MPKATPKQEEQILEGKIFATLAYLSILCIIPLVFKKDNDFALSHARQGLVLFVAEVAVFVISVVVEIVFRPAIFILGVLSLWGILEALQGKYVRLPIVSDFADKITL